MPHSLVDLSDELLVKIIHEVVQHEEFLYDESIKKEKENVPF